MIGNMKYGTDCTDPLKGVPLKCNPALLSVLKANSIGFQRVTQACPYLAAVQVI